MEQKAKNISIFLPSGNPKGIKKASITRDKIIVVLSSRLDFLENKELFDFMGIYILVDTLETDSPEIYVGKGKVQERINKHKDVKDFWNSIFAIQLNTEEGFNDSQMSFMESYFINKAKKISRCNITANKQTPHQPKLEDSIKCDLDHYIDVVEILLATLGLKIFQEMVTSNINQDSKNQHEGIEGDNIFYINSKKSNIKAKGAYTEEGFILLKGSLAHKHETESFPLSDLRKRLLEEKILVEHNGNPKAYKLTKDYKCNSPSMAAKIILGNSSNGWVRWKNSQEKTLDNVYRNNKE